MHIHTQSRPLPTAASAQVRGFSKSAVEATGGNKVEYSRLMITIHMQRHWQPFAWKIILPMVACTLYSFSARVLPADALPPRQQTHSVMFLATTALLFVIERMHQRSSIL